MTEDTVDIAELQRKLEVAQQDRSNLRASLRQTVKLTERLLTAKNPSHLYIVVDKQLRQISELHGISYSE